MATSPSDLTGLFKEAYGDEIQNLIPESAKLTKLIPFVSREKETGNKYHQPVIVANEQGVTYANPNSGAFDLEASVPMAMQDAQVQGNQLLLRSALSYDAAAKASSGQKAFVKATELLVENMMESITKRLEICMLHGQVGIGVKASSSNVDTTSTIVTLTDASFAAGIYSGAEKSKINFYLTSNGSLVSSGDNAVFTIQSVDVDNKSITVTGTSTGITALDAAGAADVYFKGSRISASQWAEMAGMRKIITNTGELFNIDASEYNLWKGNVETVSGDLTLAKLLKAVSKAVVRGLDEKVVVAVNPDTWSQLSSNEAALRRYDGSYKKDKAENGFENLCFYGQNGQIEIISHNIVKEGEAFIFPPERLKRIGAQDVSFNTPGRKDEIFLHLPNNAGFEMRVYSAQSLFIETPARCVYITGIGA